MRIGIGYDVHAFSRGRKLVLGGVDIEYELGLKGHSDADVLVHAIMDALLGAAGLEDIGVYFPDTDIGLKDISSLELLEIVAGKISSAGYRIVNIDAVLILEKPKISPFSKDMKINIAKALKINADQVNVKATTTEGLGFCGRQEGVAAQSIALLR